MKNNKDENITLVSYELFEIIPLWTVVTNYEETTYKILGLPVWKVKDMKGEGACIYKSRYYLFGLPIAEIRDEYHDEDEPENYDFEEDI